MATKRKKRHTKRRFTAAQRASHARMRRANKVCRGKRGSARKSCMRRNLKK